MSIKHGFASSILHTATALVLIVSSVPEARAFTGLSPSQMKINVNEELNCLALNIYFEARNEPRDGRRAVGHVVLNRVSSPQFPETVCEVVRQGLRNRLHKCQFSWFCDGLSDQPRRGQAWRESVDLAFKVYVGYSKDPTGGALWYHADYVRPRWRRALKRNRKIGAHIFYMHNARSKAAWARPELPDEDERTIQVSQLNEALTLDPID